MNLDTYQRLFRAALSILLSLSAAALLLTVLILWYVLQ